MVVSPSLVFGLLLATLYGALSHLILGGGGRRLLLFLLAAWLGFALGEGVGDVMGIDAFRIGAVNILSATLGALIALAVTAVLSGQQRSDI